MVAPVPPFATVRVPVVDARGIERLRDEVAKSVYVPLEFPTNICPNVGAVLIPVPPKKVERVEEAETTPLIAWRGPVNEPIVTPELNVADPPNVLLPLNV